MALPIPDSSSSGTSHSDSSGYGVNGGLGGSIAPAGVGISGNVGGNANWGSSDGVTSSAGSADSSHIPCRSAMQIPRAMQPHTVRRKPILPAIRSPSPNPGQLPGQRRLGRGYQQRGFDQKPCRFDQHNPIPRGRHQHWSGDWARPVGWNECRSSPFLLII